jgi:hypothetical protein
MQYDEWITKCEQAEADILIAVAQDDKEGYEAGMEIALQGFTESELRQFISELEAQIRSKQDVLACAKERLAGTADTKCA